MRSAVILLAGLALLGSGVALLASPLALKWWVGVPLVLVGLLVKIGGFLLTDDPVRVRPGSRTPTRLDGQIVESPRPGVPAGRSAAFGRPARAQVRPPTSPAPMRRAS